MISVASTFLEELPGEAFLTRSLQTPIKFILGQKVIKQEQKIDVMPNNVFVTKVQSTSIIYVIGSSFLPYRTRLNDL